MASLLATRDVAEVYCMIALHHSQWSSTVVCLGNNAFAIDTALCFGLGPSAGMYGDEPPHQILSYTLLFLLFLYFLYIADPPLCTTCWCNRSDHTCTCFIGPVSLIWWTHVLWFTCSIYFLGIPDMHPPAVWPITNPHTTQSGTYHSFALDEPYACFLVDHLYLTCLYLPFTP